MGVIQHVFTNPQADVTATDICRPSDWNSVHQFTLQDAVSLSGNTAGVLANISSGTLYLAGGNNLTLSQNGNSVTLSAANSGTAPPIATAVKSVLTANSVGTITRFAGEDHGHEGLYAAGVSTGGNTAGNTTVQPGRVVFVGGNNVTLSVGTAGGALQTITISAANETQTVPPIATAGKSVLTANSVGTITRFAGEDHGHEGVFAGGVSTGGNTAGNTTVQPGRIVFAGGNNITLSVGTAAGALQTITISAANETQTVPPIGTAVKGVSSIGSTGTITRFAPEDHQHAGLHSINVGGNTAGATTAGAGSFLLAGGDNITLSGATAAGGMTLSIMGATAAGGAVNMRFVELNGPVGGLATIPPLRGASLSVRPLIQPMYVPGAVIVNSVQFMAARSAGTSLVATVCVGFYTAANATNLALLSSTSNGISLTASTQYSGTRMYVVTGLGAMTLTAGRYWMGLLVAATGTNHADLALMGAGTVPTLAGSVFAGADSTAATNVSNLLLPFAGVYSAVSSSLPVSIAATDMWGGSGSSQHAPFYAAVREY